jgi:hypothetical protein
LSRDVQVVGATWRSVTRIVAGVGDLVQMTRDGRTNWVLGSRVIERSGGAVCGLHRARGDEEREFLGSASKPMVTVCEWFGLKTTRTVFACLATKPVVTVSGGFALKPAVTVSGSLGSKPAVMVSSGLASKPAVMVFTGLASKLVTTVLSGVGSKPVATISPGLASKPVVGFLVEPQNQGDGGFLGLDLKTGSHGLVIWALKSPR